MLLKGDVSDDFVPTVRVRFGRRRAMRCLVDSGFNGDLALPQRLITAERMKLRHLTMCELGDGTSSLMPMFEWNFRWLGKIRRVEVLASASRMPVMGLRLCRGLRLTFDLREYSVEFTVP